MLTLDAAIDKENSYILDGASLGSHSTSYMASQLGAEEVLVYSGYRRSSEKNFIHKNEDRQTCFAGCGCWTR